MADKDNYNEVIKDLENTLNGYDEKVTKKIIMELLKKHNEDYVVNVSKVDTEDGEYEVYSNSSVSFNDDYVPQYAKYEDDEEETEYDDDSYNKYYDDDFEYYEYEEDKPHGKKVVNQKKRTQRNNIKAAGRKNSDRDYQRKAKNTIHQDDYGNTERYERKKSGNTAPTIAKIACVMVIILAGVVIFLFNRLNSADDQIAALESSTQTEDYEAKIIELQAQVDNLNSQIEDYRRAFDDVSKEPETEKESDEDLINTDSESDKATTYTVVAGDSLAKISRKNYGSEKYVDMIKEANNISGDVLSIGQTLVMPEV